MTHQYHVVLWWVDEGKLQYDALDSPSVLVSELKNDLVDFW